jgi:hypothetical protein
MSVIFTINYSFSGRFDLFCSDDAYAYDFTVFIS